jgi:uncharacterized short protein YbdD (DUF466 family)
VSGLLHRSRAFLRAAWQALRRMNGDSAYDTYAARVDGPSRMGRKAFYLDSLDRRYRGPSRCC